MDNKQDAISRAKQAALGSISLGLNTSNVESDKLKKVSYIAAKEAVLFRKNIERLVSRFKVLDSIVLNVKRVLSAKADPKKKLARITSIILADGNKFKEAEAILSEKTDISSLSKSVAKDVTKFTLGAAAFSLALPYLLSPQVRDYVKSFFEGFLNNLGLTTENLALLKKGLVVAAAVIGGVFTLKALNVVLTSFNKMRQLAQLLGILATATNDDMLDIEVERKKKAEKLKKVKKLKRLITAASTILKGTVLAYAIGASIDAVAGTLIDIASSDDEIVPENVVKILINNLIESATFGAVKGPFETTSSDKQPTAESSSTVTPSAAPAPATNNNWNTDPNVIEVSPVTTKESLEGDKPQENKPTPKLASPVKKEAPVSSALVSSKEQSVEESLDNIIPSNIIPTGVTGNEINNLSNIVNEFEESINTNNLILVNNSTTVYQNTNHSRLYPSLAYSGSVGL